MRDAPLTYTATEGQISGTTILKLAGPLTLWNLFSFQSDLQSIKPPRLILDLTDCPYMDSAGLGALMNCYVSAQKAGRQVLLAGVNSRVRALLEVAHVHSILRSFPSVQAAEESL